MNTKTNNSEIPLRYPETDLETDITKGLDESQVKIRQKSYGLNIIAKQKKKNFFQLFLRQMKELMSLLLFISGLVALGLSIYENIEFRKDANNQKYFSNEFPALIILNYVQSSIMLLIVLINALFGAWQERKSNLAIDALQKMSSLKAKVLRQSEITMIDSSDLTIGDVIIVEAGDIVPADARIVQASNLKVIEAILTGESLPIQKYPTNNILIENTLPIAERKDTLFANCHIVNGRATAIVTAIANNTEIGKIATLLKDKKELMSPLQLKLHNLGKVVGYIGIVLTLISFFFILFVLEGVMQFGWDALTPSIILSVSVAAAAVPEGLNAVVNVVLANGVNKMAKRNGLIKKLTSVETLGSTAVICSDKTGTLTMNKMTLVKMYTPQAHDKDLSTLKDLNSSYLTLLKYATLCTDCSVSENGEKDKRIGDPTELAIVDYALQQGYSDIQWDKQYPRLCDIPFDSDRKMMTTIHKIDNKIIAIVKGAPDVLMKRCLSQTLPDETQTINNHWSDHAIRVLGVAIKELDTIPSKLNPQEIENNLTFIGLIGMIDPPREEVKASIQECLNAGIKPVMITGDHLNTAIAIAKELNIYQPNDIAITGTDLDKMTDEELASQIEHIAVYARVSPENKIRIVQAWQSKHQVVAMTGDGVNDAPALKAADIGCAMGITGTDVSKGAADMILTDDNFSTIVESVKLGRSIYDNIRRIVWYLLSSNVAWLFSIVIGIFIMYFIFDPQYLGWGAVTEAQVKQWNHLGLYGFDTDDKVKILTATINENIRFESLVSAILILINNLAVETIPGISLGLQDKNENLMNKRPRSKYESIFSDGLIKKILIVGTIIGILSLVTFILGAYIAIVLDKPGLRFYYGSTAAFIMLSFSGVVKSIWLSSSKSIFKAKWNDIKTIVYSCFISIAIILLVSLIPWVNSLLGNRPDLNSFIWVGVDKTTQDIKSLITPENKRILSNVLFGGETQQTMTHGYIWALSLSFSVLVFILLEIYKLFLNQHEKHIAEPNITSFKLIPKPLPWYEKHPWIKSMKLKSKRT